MLLQSQKLFSLFQDECDSSEISINILRALLWCHYTTHLYSWAAVFLHTESLCDQFTVIVLTSHRKLPVLHRNTPRTYQDTFSSVWPGTSDHYCWRGSSLFPCRHRLMTQRTQEKLRAADQADSGKYSIIHWPFISVVHITHTHTHTHTRV